MWSQPFFDENSANIQNRYMVWESGMRLSLHGFGGITGVTQDFTIGPVETVDGIATLKLVTDRSNDFPQQFWLAQDTAGNVWQLRNIDGLTGETHEEDVLYIPANPQVGDVYDLFDITFDSKYEVISTTASVETPLETFENCLYLHTEEEGNIEETWIAPFLGIVKTQVQGGAGGFELTSVQGFTEPASPFISVQPRSQDVVIGAATRLYLHVVSAESPSFQWYQGMAGDTSNPLVGRTLASYQTPIIDSDASYWVRATIDDQFFDSETASVSAVPDTSGPKLYGFGRNHWGQLGQGRSSIEPLPVTLIYSDVRKLSAGALFTAFITTDGALMGTGQNSDGQMGLHVAFDFVADPRKIDTDVVDLSSGAANIMYIKSDGSLWGIGSNTSGELGNGTTERTWDPVQVATDVVSVSAGRHAALGHTLFIKSDNTLWGMGSNSTGQLGDGGNPLGRSSPIEIASDVIQASSGIGHSVYITSSGNLYAMGWNQFGQLGDKTFETRTFPVLIDTEVEKAVAGNNQSYYIRKDGTLLAMGSNLPGQGPETNDPIVLDTGVDDIEPGYGQNGVYLKNGEWLSVRDGSFVLSGYKNISLGSEHTLYLLEETAGLEAIPARLMAKPETDNLQLKAVPRSVFINYQLYSSFDLQNWSLHSTQNKELIEDFLYFEIDALANRMPLFFQVLGAE